MPTALRKWFNTFIIGYLTHYVVWNHQRTIICIQIIYYLASSVQLMTWILLHALAFHPLEWLQWSLAWISSLPMGLSPSYIFWWQLMWWVTTDVAVSVCGRSGLRPFRIVAVLVCGCSGLWPFRFVAISVCGHFGCGRFGLWPIWPVTSLLTTTFTANNICQKPKNIYMQIQGWYSLREDNLKLASEYLNVTV